MRVTLGVLVLTSMTITGCARVADSRLNPFNWFGNATPVTNLDALGNIRPLVPTGALTQVVDSRDLIGTITSLSMDRTPDGAILRVSGQTQGQGFYNAELVPVQQSNGTLTVALRAAAPKRAQPGAQSITAAYVLTAAELATIRRVTVQGADNALTSGR